MNFRKATIEDINQIQIVRQSVKENVLSNPNQVTNEDCKEFLTKRGKGWVCEFNKQIVGFAIVDLIENNIWALFVRPEFEKQGIGKRLHNMMLNLYFEIKREPVWLGTDPGTRAEEFYKKCGWREVGTHGEGEVKFEMTFENWTNKKRNR